MLIKSPLESRELILTGEMGGAALRLFSLDGKGSEPLVGCVDPCV